MYALCGLLVNIKRYKDFTIVEIHPRKQLNRMVIVRADM